MTGRILSDCNIVEVRQGDSFTIKVQLKRGTENIDLSSAKLNMQVRSAEDDSLMFDLEAVGIDLQKGQAAFVLTPELTNIAVGDYKTDIQVRFADGSVNTIFPADVNKIGIFRITEQVTR